MINVTFATPSQFRGVTKYSYDAKSNVRVSTKLIGSLALRYACARAAGHISAALDALKDFNCTAQVRIAIAHGCHEHSGQIGVWEMGLKPVAHAVVAELNHLAQQICTNYPECEVVVEYSLTRTISNAA